MSTTAKLNFTENPTPVVHHSIQQGATFSHLMTVQGANGSLLDLTPYTIRSQIKSAYTAVSASADLSCRVVDPTSGQFYLEYAASGSWGLTPGCFVYDVTLDDGVTVVRLAEGEIKVTPGVTR